MKSIDFNTISKDRLDSSNISQATHNTITQIAIASNCHYIGCHYKNLPLHKPDAA